MIGYIVYRLIRHVRLVYIFAFIMIELLLLNSHSFLFQCLLDGFLYFQSDLKFISVNEHSHNLLKTVSLKNACFLIYQTSKGTTSNFPIMLAYQMRWENCLKAYKNSSLPVLFLSNYVVVGAFSSLLLSPCTNLQGPQDIDEVKVHGMDRFLSIQRCF